jgi:rhodanese-related sulfurtransferase
MRIIKELKYIFLLAIVIIVLISIRSYKRNYFFLSAAEAYQLSSDSSYLLNKIKFAELPEDKLLIDLRSEESFMKSHLAKAMNIPFQHILFRSNFKEYKQNDIILYSDDISQSVKAKLLLNQMGYEGVYILDISDESIKAGKIITNSQIYSNEDFKYKFQPDTAIRLE